MPSQSPGTHHFAHIPLARPQSMATPNCWADGKYYRLTVCQGKVEHGFRGTVSSLYPRGCYEPSWGDLPESQPASQHSLCAHGTPTTGLGIKKE